MQIIRPFAFAMVRDVVSHHLCRQPIGALPLGFADVALSNLESTMLKFFAPVILAALGLLVSTGDAHAAGGSPAQAPTKAAQLSQPNRVTRSYSYEPGMNSYEPAASYRSYGRSFSRRATGGFSDATIKGRGNY